VSYFALVSPGIHWFGIRGDLVASLTQEERQLLRPYLPRLLLQWLNESPDSPYRNVEGTIAFVDISGFTKLSERLAKKGKVGAEELTDAIGTCFTRLLGVAYGNGGGLIKFGGDALLLLFTGPDHAAKASRAAIGMRRALREMGALECTGTRVALKMSVGINSGVFNFFLVGSSHRELIVTGPAASQTVVMESTAEAGEIVVSATTAALLPGSALGDAKGPGFLLKREPPGFSPERADAELLGDPEGLIECIPASIRSRVLAGLLEPEHKRVTVAFLHFDGTDTLIERAGPEAAAAYLDALVTDTQEAVDRHGICFLGTDIDRDGGKLILSAGAPESGGNDEERMLLALREIGDVPRFLPVRVGVNRGHVFAGDIGPPYRRTYTVMGDAVNLAARVMAKAEPGRILATESVVQHSRTSFQTTPLEPFMVKGKSQPVVALEVGAVAGARKAESDVRLPLAGRDAEMAALRAALDDARCRDGRLVQLSGEPGIGKSRLVEEVAALAPEALKISVQCELYESSTPYFPFRAILRGVMGIAPDDGEDAAADTLTSLVGAVAPALMPWAPLLATVVDANVPLTTEVEQLDDEFRGAKLAETVHALLTTVLRSSTLVVIEDAQWMDEASADLLRYLAGRLADYPWLVLTTRREGEGGFVAPRLPHVVDVALAPLTAEAATAIVDAATEQSPLSPHETEALVARAGGNPMFLQEFVAAALVAGGTEGLPDNVESLITAKIDRLDPTGRTLLRHLTVLGPSFERRLAEMVLPDAFEPSVWKPLSEFLSEDRSGMVRFRHALVRDTAYEALPFRLRQGMHAKIGESIEHRAGAEADDAAEVLSMHFFHAGDHTKAWRYSRIAADRARSIYANLEAATFYERAVASSRRAGVPALDIAAAYEALGDVRRRIGEYGKAADAYHAARRLTADDLAGTVRLLLKQATIHQVTGRYPDALRWLRRTQRMIDDSSPSNGVALRAHVAVAVASVKKDQGRPREVISWCVRAVDEAQRADDKEALARAYVLLDTAYVAQGQWDKATHSRLALALYEELGSLWGQGVVLNNLGTQAYFRGRWDEALRLYEQARVVWERMGDAASASVCTANMAEILSDQGKLKEGEELFRRSLRTIRAAGDRKNLAFILGHLGRIAYRDGRFDEAADLLREAREESENAGATFAVIEIDARTAESHLLQGRADEALALAERTQERAKTLGVAGAIAPILERVIGGAHAQRGDWEVAREHLEAGLLAARSRAEEFEVGLILRVYTEVLARLGRSTSEARAESRAILDRLGVVRPPDPPVPAHIAGAIRVET